MNTATCSRENVSMRRFHELLRDFFDSGTVRAASYGPHFERMWELAGRSVSGGKLVRPRLLMESYDALTSDDAWSSVGTAAEAPDEVARLALGVEFLHYAFLLHDDVIDGDLLRRGRPNLIGAMLDDTDASLTDVPRSLHWAQTCGILMGDLLLSATHQIFARAAVSDTVRHRLLDLLDETILDSVAGEQIDVGLSVAVVAPELSTILDMTTRKTATYTFELPLRMAAVLSGTSPVVERRLGEIGRHLGLGFQLQDDLMSAFGDPARHGKDLYSDLREGKQTAIIAAARMTHTWPRIEALWEKPALSRADAARISALLVDCGAQARVLELAEQELRAAARLIDASPDELPQATRRVLRDLVAQLRGRCA